jgi:hypothetical protein
LEISGISFIKCESLGLIKSLGSLSIESIIIKSESPSIIHTEGLIYIDSSNTFSIKSTVIEDIKLNDKAVFEFGSNIPSSFTIDDCEFSDISRLGNWGGSVLYLGLDGSSECTIKKSTFQDCESGVGGVGGCLKVSLNSNSKLLIKGCIFDRCKSLLNGGAIYVELNSNSGIFSIGDDDDDDSTATGFDSCDASSGKGGGIYLKLGSGVTSGFSFGGSLTFIECSALVGKNIYIESASLEGISFENVFDYNYISSLKENSNELYGGESSSDVNLRKYLCPLQYYDDDGGFTSLQLSILFIYLFSIIIQMRRRML